MIWRLVALRALLMIVTIIAAWLILALWIGWGTSTVDIGNGPCGSWACL